MALQVINTETGLWVHMSGSLFCIRCLMPTGTPVSMVTLPMREVPAGWCRRPLNGNLVTEPALIAKIASAI
jgi:hypothetical protein